MKKICMILTIVLMTSLIPPVSFATETTVTASAVLETEKPTLSNMTAVYGTADTPTMESIGVFNKNVWVLNHEDVSGYYIGFDVDDASMYQMADGSVVEIEIEYYSRENGFFQLVYDSQKKAERRCDTVTTGNDGQWKTATFTLNDAHFGNRVRNQFDFLITIESPQYYQTTVSAASVPIRKVTVTRHVAEHTITHYGYTKETGNVFPWYQDEKLLYNEFTNTTDNALSREVTYRAVGTDGVTHWQKKEALTLSARETKTVTVNVDTRHCQLYKLYIDITDQGTGTTTTWESYDFAIVKTDPNGIKNENYYLATHFQHYGDNVDAGLDVIEKSNAYGVRTEFGWTHVYDNGNFTYKEKDKVFHNKLREHNLHLMAIYGFSVTEETGGWKYLPKTETALQSWEQGIEFVTENTKDLVEKIEIWNEPNILAFNGGVDYTGEVNAYGVKDSPQVYAEAAKRACTYARKGNPQVKVGVMSLVELPHKSAKNFFKEAMLDFGLVNYADALTLHPYSDGSAEHYHNMGDVEKEYLALLSEDKQLPVWNTEYGFSTSDQASLTEEKQAFNVVRTPIHLMGEGVGDVNVGYNFAQKGLVPTNRENNFGMVSPGFDGGADKFDKNFVPRQAFVAMTAMNYYLAQATPDGEGNYGGTPEEPVNAYDGEYIYKFNSKKFGGDVYVFWRTEAESEISLEIGAEEAILCDYFGNERRVLPQDGVCTLPIGRKPQYLVVKRNEEGADLAEQTSYTFLEETFDDYRDAVYGTETADNFDIPAGWVSHDIAPYMTGHAYTDYWSTSVLGNTKMNWGILHSVERDDGYALKMTNQSKQETGVWGGALVKYFKGGTASGDFTLEFDINHGNSGWAVGLIAHDNYDAAYNWLAYGNQWVATKDRNSDSNRSAQTDKLTKRILESHVLGTPASLPEQLGFPQKISASAVDFESIADSNGSTVQVPLNTWTHIKMDFDMDTGIYTIETTPDGGNTQKSTVTDQSYGRFQSGVMGIVLRNFPDGNAPKESVMFDNIRIYSKDAYLLNQDFNGYQTANHHRPGGWVVSGDPVSKYARPSYYPRTNAAVTSGIGVSGLEEDQAMTINCVENNVINSVWMKRLIHPAYGGESIAVEFDLKTFGSDAGWQMHRMDEEHLQCLPGYNLTAGLEQNTEVGGDATVFANIKNGNLQESCALIGKKARETVLRGATGKETAACIIDNSSEWTGILGQELSGISMAETDGWWMHYRVVMIPVSKTETRYQVTMFDGEKEEYAEFTTKADCITKPTAGIGFSALGSGSIAIDNLKVYGVSSVGNMYSKDSAYKNASVESIQVEYADGSQRPLTEGMQVGMSAKRIAVTFTDACVTPLEEETVQPLNACLTSTYLGNSEISTWKEDEKERYRVYETLEDMASLQRLYTNTTKTKIRTATAVKEGDAVIGYTYGDMADNGLGNPSVKQYLSANRKTLYFELDTDMFQDTKDYLLTIEKNLAFSDSVYATLEQGVRIRFTAVAEEDLQISTMTVFCKTDSGWKETDNLAELKQGDAVKVKVQGWNPTMVTYPLKLISAEYGKDRQLLSAKIENSPLQPGRFFEFEQEFVLENQADLDSYQCYLWNLETMLSYGSTEKMQ